MWTNPPETSDLVTVTEEILNEKRHFPGSELSNRFRNLYETQYNYNLPPQPKCRKKPADIIKISQNLKKHKWVPNQKSQKQIELVKCCFHQTEKHIITVFICFHDIMMWPSSATSVNFSTKGGLYKTQEKQCY